MAGCAGLRMRAGSVTSSCQRIFAFNVRVSVVRILRKVEGKVHREGDEMAAASLDMVSAGICSQLGARRAD